MLHRLHRWLFIFNPFQDLIDKSNRVILLYFLILSDPFELAVAAELVAEPAEAKK